MARHGQGGPRRLNIPHFQAYCAKNGKLLQCEDQAKDTASELRAKFGAD